MATSAVVLQAMLPERVIEVRLDPGSPLSVGRDEAMDLTLADGSVSRCHARFDWRHGQLWVEDQGSSNGTFVNSREVERSEVRLADRLEFGEVHVVVRPADATHRRLASYDELLLLLDKEALRAGTSKRYSLTMVRATGAIRHFSSWIDAVGARLRDVDTLAPFGTEALFVLSPNLGVDEAQDTAQQIVESPLGRASGLIASCAGHPSDGTRPHQLLDTVKALCEEPGGERVRIRMGCAPSLHTDIVTESSEMRAVWDLARMVAASDLTVLIRGETGTGKEVVADTIHQLGARRDGAIRKVNCGALPASLLESTLFGHERGAFTGAGMATRGLFEQADRGTLFLDEVGELSLRAQAVLLRALESGRIRRLGGEREVYVDVRVLAATHRDLGEMVARGDFRLDLYHRLTPVVIEVPPLRARVADIRPLALQFLRRACRVHGRKTAQLSDAAWDQLEAYAWPGNVRELRNVIERAVVLSSASLIEAFEGLGPRAASADVAEAPFKERVKDYERRLMIDALGECGGNKTAAARLLKMPLRTFMSKCASYDLVD